MRKRTAHHLRTWADKLDPKPTRWYQVGTQTGAFGTYTPTTVTYTGAWDKQPRRRRVLADYLTSLDLKKLRP